MKVPCYNCPDRFVGCHSTCSKYIEYDKNRKEVLANKKKDIDQRADFQRLEKVKYERLQRYRKNKAKKQRGII